MDLRSLQVAQDRGATRSGAPLTRAGVLAIQRTAGNRAACQIVKVQRLEHPDFPKKAAEMKDWELLKAYRYANERHVLGKELGREDRIAVFSEMRKRGLEENNTELDNPLESYRDLMPTRKQIGVEVAKPTAAVGGAAAGYLGARGHLSTAPGAISYPHHSPTSAPTALGSEIFGGLLLVDSAIGMARGYNAMGEANKRGDVAGGMLGARKVKQQSWGAAGGATGVAAGGMKLGAALGSTAAGLAAATGGLGVVGGALTVAQGSWKIYLAGKKLSALSDITPMTESGQKWKEHAQGREKRKAGINALKVAAGALGIAAGALLIASNPAGWALGIAALAVGGVYAAGKVGHKIGDVWSRRSAKKKAEARGTLDPLSKPQTPEQMADDPARRNEVHQLADKVAAENSDNAKYAAAMIAAMRHGDDKVDKKLDTMVKTRDDLVASGVFPADNDFQKTAST